jgi:hypothetical protein
MPEETPMPETSPTLTENLKPEASVVPGFWLPDTPLPVTVYVYTNRDDGRFLGSSGISLVGEDKFLGPAPQEQVESVVHSSWTIPNDPRLRQYRRQARTWIAAAQAMIPDLLTLNVFLLRYHLETLAIIDPGTGQPLKIEHTTDSRDFRRLTDETEESIYRLHPQLIETLLDGYRKQAAILL